eukprot:803267-Prymnesium_polylepis.1
MARRGLPRGCSFAGWPLRWASSHCARHIQEEEEMQGWRRRAAAASSGVRRSCASARTARRTVTASSRAASAATRTRRRLSTKKCRQTVASTSEAGDWRAARGGRRGPRGEGSERDLRRGRARGRLDERCR